MELRSHPPVLQAVALAMVLALLAPLVCSAQGLCPRVKFFAEKDRRLEIGWTMGVDERTIDDFGGYRVWVREAWNSEDFDLAREYIWGEDDSTATGYWSFVPFYEDSTKVFVLRDIQNAFPYELSVTMFKASNDDSVNTACREQNRSDIIYPRRGQSDDLSYIQVIPNPYRSSADWELGGERRVSFVRLPGAATIRIYTTAADLVRTIRHEDPGSDQASWDLKNQDGEEVAPGVYIWAVEADGIGGAEGKVLIMK